MCPYTVTITQVIYLKHVVWWIRKHRFIDLIVQFSALEFILLRTPKSTADIAVPVPRLIWNLINAALC